MKKVVQKTLVAAVTLLLMMVIVACGKDKEGENVPLEIVPADAELLVKNGVPDKTQSFEVFTNSGGERKNVTSQVSFALENSNAGMMVANEFKVAPAFSGKVKVLATTTNGETFATMTVRSQTSRVDSGVPANTPELFDNATLNSQSNLTIRYPENKVQLPANLGELDVHWSDTNSYDLYELAFTNEFLDMKIYLPRNKNQGPWDQNGTWESLLPTEWSALENGAHSSPLQISVRGLKASEPSTFGETKIEAKVLGSSVRGGIYYWSTAGGAIFRHDMDNVGEQAQKIYPLPGGSCVGCHALSRGGEKIAMENNGRALAYNIADGATTWEVANEAPQYVFASFHPDDEHFVVATGTNKVLQLGNAVTGEVKDLYAGADVTQPDFSPSGDWLVVANNGRGRAVDNASLLRFPYDPVTQTVGEPILG